MGILQRIMDEVQFPQSPQKAPEISPLQLIELRKKAHAINPLVRVGKAGLGQSLFQEITKQLKTHKLVKIKLLRNFMDDIPMTKRALGEEFAMKTNSALISVVGNTVVLWRK